MRHVRGWVFGAVLGAVLLVAAGLLRGARPFRALGPATAESAYARGDWDGAFRLARQRLRTAPRDERALRTLARASLRLGREQPALGIYGGLGGTATMRAEDLYLLGRHFRARGEPALAAHCWDQALKEDPRHAELLRAVALAELDAGKFDAAAQHAARLAALAGWDAPGTLLLGRARLGEDDDEAALAAFRHGLQRDPTARGAGLSAAGYRTLMARVLLRLGRPAEARAGLGRLDASDAEVQWLVSRAWLQEGNLQAAAAALDAGAAYREAHPLEPEPAPYVGADRCAACHRGEYDSQQHSRHSRTYWSTAQLDDPLFPRGPVRDPKDPRWVHSATKREGAWRFEARQGAATYRELVEYAFGSGDRGLTFVARDEQGRARECRLSRYGGGGTWDVTSGHPAVSPPGEHGLGRVLSDDTLTGCFDCHTTQARAARERIEPTASDRGIGCERCHGPGGHHRRAVASEAYRARDLAVAQPSVASAAQIVALCGQCHGRRAGPEPQRDDPSAARLQATTLTWSRCYLESNGRLDCRTCHDPHRNAEESASFYDARCLTCHDGAASGAPGHARTVCPVNRTTGCRSCHMPDVPGAAAHSTFADHFIRVHPQTSARP
jgi:cytochrome c553